MVTKTEDQVRDEAGRILEFKNSDIAISGVGQITTFNQLGFLGVLDKPDGWYLPKIKTLPAIILETKAEKVDRIENIEPYKPGDMTLALGGHYLGSCFIQKEPFYTSQNVNVLRARKDISFNCKLFISTMIFKESQLYYKAFENELNRHVNKGFSILLPVDKNGDPDWGYMENFIEEKYQYTYEMLDSIL